MNPRLTPFLYALAIFIADRATKFWIDTRVNSFDIVPVIPGFFNLIHSENRGMAFSLLADAAPGLRSIVLIGVSIVVLGFVLTMLWQAAARLQRVALTLVLGGALGNLYDRIMRGSVTDFLDLYLGDSHWPTFNVADSAITIGALLLAFDLFAGKRKHVP